MYQSPRRAARCFSFHVEAAFFKPAPACKRTNPSLLRQVRLQDGMDVFVRELAAYARNPPPSRAFHAMDKGDPFCLAVYLVVKCQTMLNR